MKCKNKNLILNSSNIFRRKMSENQKQERINEYNDSNDDDNKIPNFIRHKGIFEDNFNNFSFNDGANGLFFNSLGNKKTPFLIFPNDKNKNGDTLHNKIIISNENKNNNLKSIDDYTFAKESNISEKEESLLGKKKMFNFKKTDNTYNKELRLMQNRMSAKKSRQKKKEYVESLKEELKKCHDTLINQNNKKDTSSKQFLLKTIEKELIENKELKDTVKTAEIQKYKALQNDIKNSSLINCLINLIPIECRIFYKSYLNEIKEIDDCNSIEEIEGIIESNIEL